MMNIITPCTKEKFISSLLAQADITIGGDRPWDIQVHNTDLYTRVLNQGSLGLGEAYMQGWWDAKSLDKFFARILQARLASRINRRTPLWFRLLARFTNPQSKKRAFKIGELHYDLNNAFFAAMLGKTMTYTCGYWKNARTLDDAQTAKLDLICRKLQLKPGMTLLDIGCGWGSLIRYAAKHYGAICTGISVSREQIAFAEKYCAKLPINLRLMDYRNITGQFDRIASIGMFEHVGKKNYRTFFDVVQRASKPDGLFLLHTIGNRSLTGGGIHDGWLNQYIFPDGEIPALSEVITAATPFFVLEDLHNFGSDYDQTLMAWHANFKANWERFKNAFPQHFQRMWCYYLLCCAGSFRARHNQLWQFVFSPKGVLGGYQRPA